MSAAAATRLDVIDWKEAHDALCDIAKRRASLDYEEGCWLLQAERSGAHVHLGYGSFFEYVERILGYRGRFLTERMRVARALEELPETRQALRDSVLKWSVVRELTRVATPETEGEWVDAAKIKTARQIERLVSGRKKGDRPSDRARPEATRHVLRFELSPEAMATYREATAKLRRETNEPLDEDAALRQAKRAGSEATGGGWPGFAGPGPRLMMARAVLGGPADEGRANYQIAMMVCSECKRGSQRGKGELIDVDAAIVEMAECDGQTIEVGQASGPTRASQDVPPRVRREVVLRDHGQCVVPGCRSSVFIDLHHVKPRAEGGGHETDLLICLCGAHHRAAHRGMLLVEGRVSTGLTFRHADGRVYGTDVRPKAAEVMSEVFLALRSLGYKETESNRALDVVRAHVGAAPSFDEVIRAALRVLRPRPSVEPQGTSTMPSSP